MNPSTLARLRAPLCHLYRLGLAVALWWCAATPAAALVVSVGTPLTTAPSYLGIALGTGQFLVPVQAPGAVDLQAWSFDLYYDDTVVQRVTDLGGIYDGIYEAVFSSAQPTLASLTSAGFAFRGLIDDVAGFFLGGVGGDGVLAYVAFAYKPDQAGEDPGLSVDTPPEPQPFPEPAPAWLLAGALAMLLSLRRHVRAPGLLAATVHPG
jgi:hypothetical protein